MHQNLVDGPEQTLQLDKEKTKKEKDNKKIKQEIWANAHETRESL